MVAEPITLPDPPTTRRIGVERKDVGDRQLDALLERLDRLVPRSTASTGD
jgi:hypothetical protein